jgi:hypothetical protein
MTTPHVEANTAKYRDFAGIAVAALCALHCAALPLLLATAAASGLTWLLEERFEWAFLASSAVIGCASLVPAYRRVHGKTRCLALFGVGIAAIFVGRLALLDLPDTPFVLFGAVLIVASHAANHYFCRTCRRCAE